LIERFGYTNVWQAPRVLKVSVNMGVEGAKESFDSLESAMKELAMITGQRRPFTRARKSVASFGIRAGQAIGCRVTLRKARMWSFSTDCSTWPCRAYGTSVAFRPTLSTAEATTASGLTDQLVFPELGYDDIERAPGMDIAIVTSATTDEEARALLELLGLPLERPAAEVQQEQEATVN